MKAGEIISSLVHLLILSALMAAGLGSIALFYLPGARLALADAIYYYPAIFLYLGALLIAIAITAAVGFYLIHRARYYTLKMGASKTLIEESIIEDYVRNYWKELFPESSSRPSVRIGAKQQLEISAELPPSAPVEKEELLHRIENELSVLLARHLGYEEPFTLSINH